MNGAPYFRQKETINKVKFTLRYYFDSPILPLENFLGVACQNPNTKE
jgi:hypothetical protein